METRADRGTYNKENGRRRPIGQIKHSIYTRKGQGHTEAGRLEGGQTHKSTNEVRQINIKR